MRSTHFVACLALVGGMTALGCSSSNSTPTSNDYDDVAQSTAALVATPGGGGELGSMSASADIAIGTTPINVTVSGSGSFSSVQAGVTYSFDLSCTDAGGASLAHCGPTTNTAKADVSWSGNLTIPSYTASVTRNGSWTLAGLQTGTATFSGNGSFTFNSNFTSTFRNEQASANLDYSATYNAIVYNMAAHHPTSGSAHYTVNASRAASSTSGSSSRSFSIDALVTFAADGSATLTLDGAAHSYHVSASGTVIKI